MIKFIVLFLALLFTFLFLSMKLSAVLNFIIHKIDENTKSANISFLIMILSALFIALYNTFW